MTGLQPYFAAEKQAGLLALALGVAALAFATYLWVGRSALRGAAWPLAIVGLIELGVGVGLTLRTPAQVAALQAGFRDAPARTAASELDRMARVNRSFRWIMALEVFVLAAGTLLILLVRRTNPTLAAVGSGLVLQAAVLLVFDFFAEHRAHEYVRWLSDAAGRAAAP